MGIFAHNTHMRTDPVVEATAKLKKLILEHSEPDQYGRAKVEAIIEGGRVVRLIETWEGSTKLASS